MLQVSVIKQQIQFAKEIFLKKFPDTEIPPVIVCSASRRTAVRAKVMDECGIYKEDVYGTDAEVISGPLGTRILVYQSMMKTEKQVCHALWHELGHIVFGQPDEFGVILEKDTPLRSGYALINEFMAEYIAFSVNENKSFSFLQRPNVYLQMAFQQGTVTPYWLSIYFSIILGDWNVDRRIIEEGNQYVSESIWRYVLQIQTLLSKQLEKQVFWKVDIKFLEEIGCLFDDLFHVVYWS